MENLKDKVKKDKRWRQNYHLMPETGWLNDPNGAVYHNGMYHIYHQYEPSSPTGGATHWGHFSSRDLVNFNREDIFLSPDQDFDRDGVYSGSALVVGNKINFFYTGNVKETGFYDYVFSGRQQNVVRVVSSDGFNIESRKVVIQHSDFPAGYSDHIRDPKIFKRNDDYYMLLGGRTEDNRGALLLFKSIDLDNWTFMGNLYEGDLDTGFMWECPDYFNIDGSDVLIFSPQGVIGSETSFQNQYSSGYIIGQIDWETLKFIPKTKFQELDYGFDFYAPQSFEDSSGQQILWAWMGVPDHEPDYVNPTVSYGWQHCLTLPRVLKIENDCLVQQPLTGYRKYLIKESSWSNQNKVIFKEKTDSYVLEIKFSENQDFNLKVRQDTLLSYDCNTGFLVLSHKKSGYGRRRRKLVIDKIKEIEVYSDHSSLEIFINGGQKVMSTRLYPDRINEGAIELNSKMTSSGTFYRLELENN